MEIAHRFEPSRPVTRSYLKRVQIKVEYGQLHAMAAAFGGAVARNRFGSHPRILQISQAQDPSGSPL